MVGVRVASLLVPRCRRKRHRHTHNHGCVLAILFESLCLSLYLPRHFSHMEAQRSHSTRRAIQGFSHSASMTSSGSISPHRYAWARDYSETKFAGRIRGLGQAFVELHGIYHFLPPAAMYGHISRPRLDNSAAIRAGHATRIIQNEEAHRAPLRLLHNRVGYPFREACFSM